MSNLPTVTSGDIQIFDPKFVPALFANAGPQATTSFIEFFTATIRNANTRQAYGRAVYRFADWCEVRHLELLQVNPVLVAAYIETLMQEVAAPTVKQHLAAIRMLFDYLVTTHVVPVNPAASVRGPKHVVKTGKTPVLTAEEMRHLFDSIPTDSLSGLRDRALIGVMAFSLVCTTQSP